MPQPTEPAPDESNLFSEIRALLEEHHANLMTHMESCVSSAVNRSLNCDLVMQPGCKPTALRSTSSLSSIMEQGKDQDALPKVASSNTQHTVHSRYSRREQSLTMSERDDLEREEATKFHEREAYEMQATMSHTVTGTTRVERCRTRVKKIVELRKFEIICAVLILLNSVMIGVEIQLHIDDPENKQSELFVVAQCIFCVVFLSELLVRMVAEGLVKFFMHSEHLTWNYVDVFIVSCMIIEVAIELFITLEEQGNSKGMRGVGNVRLLRILRVFRLIRTLRMVRVIRFVRDLRLLMNSIMSTLYALGWSLMLLMMIIYVFAIVFTQEASDYLLDKDPERTATEGQLAKVQIYFGTLPESMFTLFKAISNGVSWHEPVEALDEISFLCTVLFTIFVAFVYFAVLNVVTGVFCTSAIESSLRDHEHAVHVQIQNKKMWQKKMETLFKSIDSDGSKFINIHEFEQGLASPQVKAYMASMELDPDDAWTLFKLLDTDSTQSVDVEEFVLGCLRLRGPARSLDVAKLIYDTRMMSKRQEFFMDFVESQLSRLAIYSHYTAAQVKAQKKKGSVIVNGGHETLPPVLARDELQKSRQRSNSISRQASPNSIDLTQFDGDMYGVLSARSSPADEENGVNGIQEGHVQAANETKARSAPALTQPKG